MLRRQSAARSPHLGSFLRLPKLRAVKYPQDNDRVVDLIDPINDDIRQPCHNPLARPAYRAPAAYEWQCAKLICSASDKHRQPLSLPGRFASK